MNRLNQKIQKVSVVIPIYNELESINQLISEIRSVFETINYNFEIIFVDDNSTDGTDKFIDTVPNLENVIYLKKKGKKGKAYSLLEGFEKSNGDIICMIDGDLQYPTSAIGGMIETLKDADIVVANRKKYNDSKARKILSKTFRTVFGRILFGLSHDIQSGLKIFKREVVKTIKFIPASPWTFDLEFLHRAREAGYKIKNFDINFLPRAKGNSSVRFLKQSIEIGMNALKVRAKNINPVRIPSENSSSMLGAGMGYKKNRYITHTTIKHESSAMKTFTFSQKVLIGFIFIILIIGFYLSPLITLQLFVGALSFIYFADVLFNLFLITKSLQFPYEITSSKDEIDTLLDKDLPIYTILCPLYKEAQIIPQFLNGMEKLSWPKEKLDIIFLLEEDDKITIKKAKDMNLPSYVRTLVVPHSIPKTKPKACNYGLAHAKGDYLVIFDAEDIPEPDQLKKAYLGFKKVNKNVICLQAKLNYYNPHQNLLTRFFTAEYSLWFDVTLTGLQSLETTIPLGGTSNHFKTESLREVEGWDPFNVTEDADLGVRLFKKGYKTAIIDSTTLEEANSRWGNWLRQRSRWIKGYMQTYLVHTRDENSTIIQGKHDLIFHLIVGGKIAFVLINPLLWVATISYFALYAYVGPQIEALYPSVVFYMAAFSLVFGNFLFLYYYMIGVAKKEQWALMKYVLLIPFYWLAISIAASIALYQLIFKPHYWEKTLHGLHLTPQKEEAVEEIVPVKETIIFEPERSGRFGLPFAFSDKIQSQHIAGGVFIFANAVGSFMSLIFISFLGRALSFQDFALVGLINGLLALVGIIYGSLGVTIIHRTGYLMGKYGDRIATGFWIRTRKNALKISIAITLLWVATTPFLITFFKLPTALPLLLFSPILLVNLAAASDKGLMFSKSNFKKLATLSVLEPLLKLAAAAVFVYLGFKHLAYISIPLATIVTFLVGWVLIYKNKKLIVKIPERTYYRFPFKFFIVSLFSGIALIMFLNLDVILAKHYLSAKDAGIYALSAVIAKMIFFLGGLVSPFTIPFVSKNEGAGISSKRVLNITLLATLAITIPGFLAIAIFGKFFIPVVFGEKALATLPYITQMSFAMVCFSISKVLTDYYLAKKYYSFPFVALALGAVQLVLLDLLHSNILVFVNVMSLMWICYLEAMLLLHIFSDKVKAFEHNVADFIALFQKINSSPNTSKDSVRILIYNWRDTRHVWSGGAEVYIHELAKRWVAEGNSVTIFCGNSQKSPQNDVIDGVNIIRRGGFFTVYIWGFVYYIFKFRGKFDLMIDSENGIPFFSPLYSRIPKLLLIHHVHQEVFRRSLRWPFYNIAQFLEGKLMPLVYRNVQVITVSPSSKDEIIKYKLTKRKPLIIYNGVDTSLYKPSKKSENPMILYLGRLQYYKSLHVFIIAAKKIVKKIPNVEFVIAGEGEEKSNLIKLAKEKGILSNIKFMGRVTKEEKISLFQKAWVFVNPSLMEGWGITTIEANASGTPVVASDVPGLRDSVRHNNTGFLVRYGKYQGFTKAITELILDKKLREKMSAESVKWAQKFSWEKSTTDFLEHIKLYANIQPINRRSGFNYIFGRFTSIFLGLTGLLILIKENIVRYFE